MSASLICNSFPIFSLIFLIVSTTILCCDCLPVKNNIFLLLGDSLLTFSAAARDAAVFPIPVGAEATRKPFSWSISIESSNISFCDSRKSS